MSARHLTPEQLRRLRMASLCPTPISARTAPKTWARSRQAVLRALKGRSVHAGLIGAVFIESCQAADRYLMPGTPSEVAARLAARSAS
jgi:hypothetical protein